MHDYTEHDEDDFKADLVALVPHMRAFARHLCHDVVLADDLVQDALLRAWNSRGGFTPGTNLKAWTFTILRNGFLSLKRRDWRSCELDPMVAEETLCAVTNPASALELNELRRAMAMLPSDQNEALLLVGAAGLSYDEAAGICDVAVGTIKSRVSRARLKLRELLKEGDLMDDGILPHNAMSMIERTAEALRAA